jgi:uncharacterized protein YjlB
MSVLEDVKGITEKVTGWRRPYDLPALLQQRKSQTYRFKDDGLISSHPLFESNGWGDPWRNGIFDYAHYHSCIHEVLGITRGTGKVQLGRSKGRTLLLKAGDVAILPTGTGHQCLKSSDDFLVVGAYPRTGTFDICTMPEDLENALITIPKVAQSRKDPVYGAKGPLMRTWRKRQRTSKRRASVRARAH